jgi:hypothetical protein
MVVSVFESELRIRDQAQQRQRPEFAVIMISDRRGAGLLNPHPIAPLVRRS